jgi:hypothetical protein
VPCIKRKKIEGVLTIGKNCCIIFKLPKNHKPIEKIAMKKKKNDRGPVKFGWWF